MASEPKELTKARELLGKFEVEMRQCEGMAHLSEGLSLLAEIRATAESERITQIVATIALTYANKVRAEVERLLAEHIPPHVVTVAYWQQVLKEFERSGLSLPEGMVGTFMELSLRKLSPLSGRSSLRNFRRWIINEASNP